MALGRRTRAAGRSALACGMVVWLFAATAFMTPGGQRATGLRGSQARAADTYQLFAAEREATAEQPINWRSLAGLAAGFGLAAAVMTTPVLAQDGVVEGAQVADPTAPARQRKSRGASQKASKKSEGEKEAKSPGEKSPPSVSVPSVSLPSISLPGLPKLEPPSFTIPDPVTLGTRFFNWMFNQNLYAFSLPFLSWNFIWVVSVVLPAGLFLVLPFLITPLLNDPSGGPTTTE